MKRTCSDGVLDFDAMNAFCPDNKKPFCQLTASGCGLGTDGRMYGPSIQTDDTGAIILYDMAFKMLCDLCIRAGLDSLRYLYQEAGRGMARENAPAGLVKAGGQGPVPDLLRDMGLSQVLLPDLSMALEGNLDILDAYDAYAELQAKAGQAGPLHDLYKIMDAFLYIQPGRGTFMALVDGVSELGSRMPVNDFRMFVNAFYKSLNAVRPMAFSGLSTRAALQHACSCKSHAEPAMLFEDAYGGAGEAPAGMPEGVPAMEDGQMPQQDGDDGQAFDTDADGPSPEDAVGPDIALGNDAVADEPDADAETEISVELDSEADNGNTEADGVLEDVDTKTEAEPENGSDGVDAEAETDTDSDETETDTDNGGTETDTDSDGTETDTEPGADGAGTDADADPILSASNVHGVNVGALLGVDETYTSDYEFERYEQALEQTDPDGLLEATVKSRANGTDGPIDVLTLRAAAKNVFQPGDVAGERAAENLREKMGEIKAVAVEAAGGDESVL